MDNSSLEIDDLRDMVDIEKDRASISLTCKRPYLAGEIITQSLPFAQVTLGIHKKKRCDFCLKLPEPEGEPLKRCSKCKQFYYCSVECQNLDWTAAHRHKECLLYQLDKKKILRDNECSRLMARLYLIILARPKLRTKEYTIVSDQKESFSHLQAHYENTLKDAARMKDFTKFYTILHKLVEQPDLAPAQQIKQYLSGGLFSESLPPYATYKATSNDCYWNKKLMFEYFCKICTNAYTMSSQDLINLATSIYIHGAVLDHSCYPTAAISFINNRLILRTACDIRPGSKILVPYCDLKQKTESRNQFLLDRYYFTCKCLRCTQFINLEETMDFRGLKNLDNQLDKNIELNNLKDAFRYGMKALDLYCKIYRQSYHPDLTLQLMRVGKLRLRLGNQVKDSDYEDCSSLLFFKEKILTHIRVTHGFGSPLHKEYLATFGTR